MSVPAPIIAECYPWASGDTIAAEGGTIDSAYPGDNIKDPSLMFTSRTGTAGTDYGWRFTLATAATVFGVGTLQTENGAGEKMQILLYSDAFTTIVINTARRELVAPEIWTDLDIEIAQPTNEVQLAGIDTLTTGPTPADPPAPAPVSCKTGIIRFSSAAAGRTFWELGFAGLAVNAVALPELVTSGIAVDQVPLRGGGTGYRWEITWPYMKMSDVAILRSIQRRVDRGYWPFFLCPNPGQKTAGVITGDGYNPETRGGLARFLGLSLVEQMTVGGTRRAANVRLSAETWSDEATGGGGR